MMTSFKLACLNVPSIRSPVFSSTTSALNVGRGIRIRDPHSTSKCNTCGFEDFRWCFESEAFPRPVIEPALNRSNLVRGDRSKVRLLGEEPSDHPDGVLHRAPLPTVVGLTEPGTGAQDEVG